MFFPAFIFGTSSWGIAVTDFRKIVVILELWVGKAIEVLSGSEGLFCGSLEVKNVEDNEDNGCQCCEASEGITGSSRTIRVMFCIKNLWLWSSGA